MDIKKIKCSYGEKGDIRYIPEHLVNDFEYMRKHNLHRIEEPNMPPIMSEGTELNLDLTPKEENKPDEFTKEQLCILLDQKGVAYKKTYGVEKLKELLN